MRMRNWYAGWRPATHAAIGDAKELHVLKAAGAGECDCAIVAIGEDLAASVVITMNLKDLGVPYIVCRPRMRCISERWSVWEQIGW